MFRLLKYTFLLILLGILGCEQKSSPTAFEHLLEEGYEVFFSDTLHIDQKDLVLAALKRQNEDSLLWETREEMPRPLLILEAQSSGKFDIALRNDKVILCGACGGVFGDPLDMIEAADMSFTISHYGGSRYRWTRHISFEYDEEKNAWLLASDKGVSYDNLNPEGEMENIVYTKTEGGAPVLFEAFNVNASSEE